MSRIIMYGMKDALWHEDRQSIKVRSTLLITTLSRYWMASMAMWGGWELYDFGGHVYLASQTTRL